MNMSKAWRDAVLEHLMKGGPICQHAAQYVAENGIEIGFSRQENTGARWTFNRRIELSLKYYPARTKSDPASPQLLGAVVHEATHLEQGAALALSVAGEVGGWKAEYDARIELGAPIKNAHWKAVALTPDACSNQDLRQARSEMLQMTGYRYLVWLLPLRPNLLTGLVERLQKIISRSAFEKAD
ncbi:MAG: hypothetical protein GY832_07950 [Chloroflexi bacterium]|nr:hypothetical protein [Chloroflexota bacterium]